MAKPPGLIQRGRVWYYRKRVPVGRFHEEAAKLEAEFAEIRRRRAIFVGSASKAAPPEILNVSEEEAIAIARRLVSGRLAAYDQMTARETRKPTDDQLSDLREELSGDIGRFLNPDSEEADQTVYLAAVKALKREGYVLEERQKVGKLLIVTEN